MRLLIVGMISFITLISSAQAAEKITIVGDPWCPYNCGSTDKNQGFLVEIGKRLFNQAGIEVEYKIIPWSRAINDVRAGKYHALVGAYKDDAPDFVYPSKPLAESINGFYLTSPNTSGWKFQGIPSIQKKRIGIINDYSYGHDLDAYFKKHTNSQHIQRVSGDNALELNIKKLQANRIDLLIEDVAVINYGHKNHSITTPLTFVGKASGEGVYIAFSPKDKNAKRYATILSEGLVKLKSSGEYNRILASYGVK